MNTDFHFLEAKKLLMDLIRIPSISKDEKSAADFLEKHMAMKGIESGRFGNNIWSLSPAFNLKKPTLLLNSHIDTVKPVSGWTIDPFTPLEKNSKLYGLGSNDAGASLVTLFEVFQLLIKKEQHYNLIYLASCEEEISGENGISAALSQLPPIDFALVGEPTLMQPAIAEKGLMVLDVIAKGKSRHAARNEGINAIYKAIEDILWFKEYHFDKTSEVLGEVKMTVTQIESGTQHNVIPDQCAFVVDVRSNGLYSNQDLYEIISKNIFGNATPRSTRLNASHLPDDHFFIQKAKNLGLVPFGSPTLSDQSQMDFPSVKIGPGDSARSHTADEYINLSELAEAIPLYYKLLNGLVIT
ncbi:MAG: M20 family metallo-hydrolase [Bacteroidales bacterium]|nr:M20 family metallo-hydrolase [Bacteroidales bacterium]